MREETDISKPIKPKPKRPFGVCYGKRTRWFERETSRNQAHADFINKCRPILDLYPGLIKHIKKVNRKS